MSEAVVTKKSMNNERNVKILLEYEVCSKSITSEAVFTKKSMNNVRNVIFL